MTIKVNRHKVAEEYNTTSDWLKTHLSTRYSSTEKFATIEEKMDDIKSRVGFDKVKAISKEAGCDCGVCPTCIAKHEEPSCGSCGSCDTCSMEMSAESIMTPIKTYIIGVIEDPMVENSISNILNKCESNKDIQSLMSKVKNQPLLIEYIQDNIVQRERPLNKDTMSYIPLEEAHSMNDIEENDPEYVHYGEHT